MSALVTYSGCYAVPTCTRASALHAQAHLPYMHWGCSLTFTENLLFNPLAFHYIKVF